MDGVRLEARPLRLYDYEKVLEKEREENSMIGGE